MQVVLGGLVLLTGALRGMDAEDERHMDVLEASPERSTNPPNTAYPQHYFLSAPNNCPNCTGVSATNSEFHSTASLLKSKTTVDPILKRPIS